MHYILIIITMAYSLVTQPRGNQAWPIVTMQEFNTQKACEDAANKLLDNNADLKNNFFKAGDGYSGMRVMCYPKGETK